MLAETGTKGKVGCPQKHEAPLFMRKDVSGYHLALGGPPRAGSGNCSIQAGAMASEGS